jgi:hypothetical protein
MGGNTGGEGTSNFKYMHKWGGEKKA